MKNFKYAGLIGLLTLGAVVSAQVGVSATVNATAKVGNTASAGVKVETTSTTTVDDSAVMEATMVSSSTTEEKSGNEVSMASRLALTAMVMKLNATANHAGGIGPEIRAVAKEHASSSENAIEAREKVEARKGLVRFIIGSDYKNLGKIRSSLATTENSIKRLEAAKERTTDATVKAELQAQIDVLKAEQATTTKFVTDNESKFSMFGWFVKLFVKGNVTTTATTTPTTATTSVQ